MSERTAAAGPTTAAPDAVGATLVDAHAHLHPCFRLAEFLDGAWRSFTRAAAVLGQPLAEGVLLLAQCAGDRRFERLAGGDTSRGASEAPGAWSLSPTGEPESLIAERADGARLFIVCGRQIQTREGLEVLALASVRRFGDGQPIARALAEVEAAGALAVLPWGVGKWLGRRGRIVRSIIDGARGALACGDSGNRPSFWPMPALLRHAARRGLRVLPGSDPLPLPSEAGRAGRYGFACGGLLPRPGPAGELRRRLADPGAVISPCGGLETPLRFCRNQLLLRVRHAFPCRDDRLDTRTTR